MKTDLINWGALSRMLSGSRQNIQRKKIPAKYRDQVNKLLAKIEQWKAELKM